MTDLAKVIGAEWQALDQGQKDAYIKRAAQSRQARTSDDQGDKTIQVVDMKETRKEIMANVTGERSLPRRSSASTEGTIRICGRLP